MLFVINCNKFYLVHLTKMINILLLNILLNTFYYLFMTNFIIVYLVTAKCFIKIKYQDNY